LLLCEFEGFKETSFEGGIFKMILEIPVNYPHNPPKLKFITKLFHPNIDL